MTALARATQSRLSNQPCEENVRSVIKLSGYCWHLWFLADEAIKRAFSCCLRGVCVCVCVSVCGGGGMCVVGGRETIGWKEW